MHLVVTRPFANRERGEVITGADEIAAVLASEFADHVVAVAGGEVSIDGYKVGRFIADNGITPAGEVKE